MDKKNIQFDFLTGNDLSELDKDLRLLVDETIAFAQNSYSPYSKFKVSACLRLDSGEIVKGANVENASYPVSICAERTLLSYTVSNFPSSIIEVIAIYVDKNLDQPVSPCGLCRQTLLEVEGRQKSSIKIILIAKTGSYIIIHNCRDLLPLSFGGKYL